MTARLSGTSARLAAAGALTSGPGCRPSSRISRAGGAEGGTGPGKNRAYIRDRVTTVEDVQRHGGLAQLGREYGEWETPTGDDTGGGDDQGQWKPGAAVDDVVRRAGFAGHPVGADAKRQQVTCLGDGEGIQRDQVGGFGGDQAAELVPAGHDRQAPRRARKQRADLLGAPRVVQHQQYPLASEQAPVQRGLGRQARRDPFHRHPERVKEPAHRLGLVHCLPGRIETAQVDIQLPIGELSGHSVCPVHSERRLSHARGPRDHRDRRRGDPCLAVLACRGQDRVETVEFGAAPHERGRRRRQLGRNGNRLGHGQPRDRRRGRIEGGILPQDRDFQVAEPLAWVDPQLVAEHTPQAAVHRERIGLPGTAVQRQHELSVYLLIERVVLGQPFQLRKDLSVLPGRHPRLKQGPPDLETEHLQPVRLLLEPLQVGQIGQRWPAPQLQRGLEVPRTLDRIG